MDKQQKNIFKKFDWYLCIKMILWCLFILCLLAFTIYFTIERQQYLNYVIPGDSTPFAGMTVSEIKKLINDGMLSTMPNENGWTLVLAYKTLYSASLAKGCYLFTNFSLMTFINSAAPAPATDPTTAWTNRANALDLAYSYMFITLLIALIALVLQIIVVGILVKEHRKNIKCGLQTKYPTSTISLSVFKIKMYTDFVISLAIVFAFFNFLSTLIVVGYWILNIMCWAINKKMGGSKSIDNDTLKEQKSNLQYLAFVMLYQNIYTLVKALFLSYWGVNLDLIFSIILPIGTITVIVGLFIKNLLSSKISNVIKEMKNINNTVKTFRTFYYTNKVDALNDFAFVSILPPMVKAPLLSGKITKEEATKLMDQLDSAIKFIEQHYAKDVKEQQFMLYTLINNVTSYEQIQEMQGNTIKLEQYYKAKRIKKNS